MSNYSVPHDWCKRTTAGGEEAETGGERSADSLTSSITPDAHGLLTTSKVFEKNDKMQRVKSTLP